MSDNAISGQPAGPRPGPQADLSAAGLPPPPAPPAAVRAAARDVSSTGFLQTADHCKVCGLDFKFIDSGDGPAVFVILIVGFLVVGLALLMEVLWQPPLWLQMLILGPLTIGLSLGMIRPLKGWLIARQYQMKAAEGRVEEA